LEFFKGLNLLVVKNGVEAMWMLVETVKRLVEAIEGF
jgi:hypothetical protein